MMQCGIHKTTPPKTGGSSFFLEKNREKERLRIDSA
jgi:hypothetical protein